MSMLFWLQHFRREVSPEKPAMHFQCNFCAQSMGGAFIDQLRSSSRYRPNPRTPLVIGHSSPLCRRTRRVLFRPRVYRRQKVRAAPAGRTPFDRSSSLRRALLLFEESSQRSLRGGGRCRFPSPLPLPLRYPGPRHASQRLLSQHLLMCGSRSPPKSLDELHRQLRLQPAVVALVVFSS
ncbi:hypothetical protein TYRP_015944 [Tyrophagus putrescentiae]|nr:hypothetical protein TYRP_015944 [Tyrophagus putrescentiae]